MSNSLEIISNPLVTDFIVILLENGEIRAYKCETNKLNSIYLVKLF